MFLKDTRFLEQEMFVPLLRDDSKYGCDSDEQNFYLKLHHEFQKKIQRSIKNANFFKVS